MNTKATYFKLIPGFAISPIIFEQWAKKLTAVGNVNSFNPLRIAPGSSSLATLENLSVALGDSLHQEEILIGWSLGGLIAIKTAELFPEKVKKIVLIASSPKMVASADWPGGISLEAYTAFKQDFLTSPQNTLKDFIELHLRGALLSTQEKQSLHRTLVQDLPELPILQSHLQLLEDINLIEQFKNLSIPVLSIFGGLDRLIPPFVSRHLYELKKHRSVVLSRATHAPFLSHEDDTLEEIISFINHAH